MIEFVMRHSQESRDEQLKHAEEEGWIANSWYRNNCDIAILTPNPSMKVWGNIEVPKVPGGVETTDPWYILNYELLWEGDNNPSAHWTFSYCHKNDQVGCELYYKQFFFAVNSDAVTEANDGILPPGDGTKERDNGVRADMSYRTELVLSAEDKCKMKQKFSHLTVRKKKKNRYDENTEPTFYNITKDCSDC